LKQKNKKTMGSGTVVFPGDISRRPKGLEEIEKTGRSGTKKPLYLTPWYFGLLAFLDIPGPIWYSMVSRI